LPTIRTTRANLFLATVTALLSLLSPYDSKALAATAPNSYALVQRAIDGYVLPHIAELKSQTERLALSVDQLCQNGAEASREEVASEFRKTVEAYAAIEFFRFGPLVEKGRREKLSFWPDPRGIVPRQLRLFMANQNLSQMNADAISKQSAALQGLPALEYLLTDNTAPLGPDAKSTDGCALANAISQNIVNNARDLEHGWTKDGGWKDKMLRPGSDNDTYKDPNESASEFVKALLVGFQLLADVQIKPRFDATRKQQGHITLVGPYEKSGLVKAYYAASVASLQKFYDTLAMENFLPEEQDWVKNWAGGAWRTMRASDGVGGRRPEAGRDDTPSLRELFDKITGLRKLVSREMAASAGLTVGFNELDGD
jgi:predicted lipoprotein